MARMTSPSRRSSFCRARTSTLKVVRSLRSASSSSGRALGAGQQRGELGPICGCHQALEPGAVQCLGRESEHRRELGVGIGDIRSVEHGNAFERGLGQPPEPGLDPMSRPLGADLLAQVAVERQDADEHAAEHQGHGQQLDIDQAAGAMLAFGDDAGGLAVEHVIADLPGFVDLVVGKNEMEQRSALDLVLAVAEQVLEGRDSRV